MKHLLPSSKKAVSPIIGYVLLVAFGLALSVIVFSWLKSYVSEGEVLNCEEGTSLVIFDFECKVLAPEQKYLELTIKNNGRFNVSGFIVRSHNDTEAKIGLFLLEKYYFKRPFAPGETIKRRYEYPKVYGDNRNRRNLTSLTIADVQPFIILKNKEILCPSYSRQNVNCN